MISTRLIRMAARAGWLDPMTSSGVTPAVVLSPSSMAAKRALLTAAFCAIAATALAGPEVDIRAHTQLTFDGIRRTYDGGITGVGALRDKLTGDPIPNQRVTLTVEEQTYDGYTDDNGKFVIA